MTNESPAGTSALGHAATWQPDVLGSGYEYRTLELGRDPDGEGDIAATLVRHLPDPDVVSTADAVLYVHGFTDYFFQQHLAEHFAARGHRFYALDLRKCGRSLRPGQTPHFISDLAFYDAELNASLRAIGADTDANVLVAGHSTGGLVTSLWLDRLQRAGARRRPVSAD